MPCFVQVSFLKLTQTEALRELYVIVAMASSIPAPICPFSIHSIQYPIPFSSMIVSERKKFRVRNLAMHAADVLSCFIVGTQNYHSP